MIQYKLIQEYPGSPKLGTIHWFQTDEFGPSSNSIWQGTNFYNSHPQFWKKVEEVDYEILKVIDREGTVISKNGYTFPECFQTLVNAKDTFEIFSVKRLSDGEVFTIGDVLKYKSFGIKKITIDRFDVLDRSVFAFGNNYGTKIIAAEKVKTPLFTTEDGIELYEGDCCYYVRKIDCRYEADFLKKVDKCNGHWISFSTKEKAEEWILLNKPVLSLNDLLKKFYPKDYNFKKRHNNGAMEDIHTNDLIELAKSKL